MNIFLSSKYLLNINWFLISVISEISCSITGGESGCSRFKEDCIDGEITYYYYNMKENVVQFRTLNKVSIKKNANKPLKIIIHDWKGNQMIEPIPELIEEYVKTGEYSIISLDWKCFARETYKKSIKFMTFVTKCAVKMLKSIFDLNISGIKAENTDIIGIGLGAHLGGMIARSYTEKTKIKFKRITALDPAIAILAENITKNDSQFLDVVHSDCGKSGITEAIGHVDFYINACMHQPGCMKLNISCDHIRAALVYADTIDTGTKIYGAPCDLYGNHPIQVCLQTETDAQSVPMGEPVDYSSRGTYIVLSEASRKAKLNTSAKHQPDFKIFAVLQISLLIAFFHL